MIPIVIPAGDGDDVSILEGAVEIVTECEGLERIDYAYRAKYVDLGSGAQASIFEPEADLYCINVKQGMPWEYDTVANRTDWNIV